MNNCYILLNCWTIFSHLLFFAFFSFFLFSSFNWWVLLASADACGGFPLLIPRVFWGPSWSGKMCLSRSPAFSIINVKLISKSSTSTSLFNRFLNVLPILVLILAFSISLPLSALLKRHASLGVRAMRSQCQTSDRRQAPCGLLSDGWTLLLGQLL